MVGQVRRLLSVMAVRSQAECCLNRMRVVGRGVSRGRWHSQESNLGVITNWVSVLTTILLNHQGHT